MKKWRHLLLALTACYQTVLVADDGGVPQTQSGPWLTGTLLAPTGLVVPNGHYEIEPYIFCSTNTGRYDSNWKNQSTPNFFALNPQIITIVGLSQVVDIQFTPQAFYNYTQGKHSWNIGDFPVGFDFQLFTADNFKWFPALKLGLRETFPTGHYQHLNPDKQGTDSTGAGSFATTASLVFYRVYHIKGEHYLSFTLGLSDTVSSTVHVHGFNTYGGGYGTNGKVYPGNFFQAIMSFEYSLTQNWVLALDAVYNHTARNRFSGYRGINNAPLNQVESVGRAVVEGIPASIGGQSNEQFSLAPAIEYNFNPHCGMIIGAWVTVAGRNIAQFRDGVVAVDFMY